MQKKKGISLIVLVITIIVMIILAASVVITLSNSGVISKSKNAVDSSNDVMVKERLQLAWAEAYENGNTGLEKLVAGVEREKEKLQEEGVDISQYSIEVTLKGVTVESKTTATENGGWVQNGTTITKGNITLNVGDKVNYNEGSNVQTDMEWRVLGVNNLGQVELLSSKQTTESIELSGKDDYMNSVTILDGACNEYAKGNGASKGRSIKDEDIIKLSEYAPLVRKYKDYTTNPTEERLEYYTIEKKEIKQIFRVDTLEGDSTLYCNESVTNKRYVIFPDGTRVDESNPGPIEKTGVLYDLVIQEGTPTEINLTTKMACGENFDGNYAYWVASPMWTYKKETIGFGWCVPFFNYSYNSMYLYLVYDPVTNFSPEMSFALRPVVSLKSNVTLTKNANGIYEIN